MRRVVITGLGAVSSFGLSAETLWQGLISGKSGIGPLTIFNAASFPSRIAGIVPPFKTTDYVPKSYRKATKIMARDIELAVIAADGAVRSARLATRGMIETFGGPQALPAGWKTVDPTRIGCNIGAGLICADLNEMTSALVKARNPDLSLNLATWGHSAEPGKTSGMENLTPLWLLKYLPNMLACHVSIIHDTQGPSNTITCGQASAGLALMEACRTIQRGNADVALVGGCESVTHPVGLMRWSLLNRLTTTGNEDPAHACKPLDKAASGTVIGEGGAVLVLEDLESARTRGAVIYAEIAGLGASATGQPAGQCDSTGESMAYAIKKALGEAAIGPDDVNMIIPPGYGIPATDAADIKAIHQVFSSRPNPWVVGLRGATGDCGAGSQALDIVAAAMAVHQQTVPPGINTLHPLDSINVPHTPQTGIQLHHVLVAASSMAGQNSTVVLKKYV